jgi:hypothetical protein
MWWAFVNTAISLRVVRAVVRAFSRRLLTAVARVRSQVGLCVIYGGQSGAGKDFSPSYSIFLGQYNAIYASYLFVYHLGDRQRAR